MKELLIFFCTMALGANGADINERDTKTRGLPSNWRKCEAGIEMSPMNICNTKLEVKAVDYNSEDERIFPKLYRFLESQRDAVLKVQDRTHSYLLITYTNIIKVCSWSSLWKEGSI
jgi:hypothetical protein